MDYLKELFCLEGKVAGITGAGGQLCGCMARSFGKAGIKVAVLDKNLENAKKTVDSIVSGGGSAFAFRMDVKKKEDHERALAEILKKYGDVDILINGAGINAPTPFFDVSEDEWQGILDVNLKGTFFSCQVFGKYMTEKKKGCIINMSSMSSDPPLSKAFTYSVSKAGVSNLTKNLAREWAKYNVRVNALRPGFFPTEWSRRNFITPEREKAILGHTPMGRYGEPEELVGMVLYLASKSASFVTGAEFEIDGGFSAMTI